MTQVDFYILPDTCHTSRYTFVCRLAEKSLKSGQTLQIHTGCTDRAQQLDDLLWSFRNTSFLPHSYLTGNRPLEQSLHKTTLENVLITDQQVADGSYDILLNLAPEVPPFFSRHRRTIEVVNQHDEIRLSGRKRYSFYKDRGYPLRHFQI